MVDRPALDIFWDGVLFAVLDHRVFSTRSFTDRKDHPFALEILIIFYQTLANTLRLEMPMFVLESRFNKNSVSRGIGDGCVFKLDMNRAVDDESGMPIGTPIPFHELIDAFDKTNSLTIRLKSF